MHDINFEQYKVFYFVAKNLSFSLAAKELFISQSAVSQSIKNLEIRLGISLFLRQAKKIALTDDGKVLFESVNIAFSHIINAENTINDHKDSQKNELKIAAPDTICKYFLLPYIEKFNHIYPEVKLKISNKPSSQCVEMLKNCEVDLSIISHNENFELSGFTVKNLKKSKDVFVAGSKYSYLIGKKLSVLDISSLPILTLAPNSSTRNNFDFLVKSYNFDIVPEIETQSIGLLKDLVRIGLGISYMSDISLSKTTDLFVLDVIEPLSCNFISVLTPKHINQVKFIDEFVNIMKNF